MPTQKNIFTAIKGLFSNSKPAEFTTRRSIEQALAAVNSPNAAKPMLEPTVLADKGLSKGAILQDDHGAGESYHKYMQRESMRHMRYNVYERMDSDLVASALDVYANEATQKNADGTIVGVYSESKFIEDELSDMLRVIGINNQKSWMIIRNMCKYGDHFASVKLDSVKGVVGLKDLEPLSIYRLEQEGELVGYVQDTEVLRTAVQNANVTSAGMNPYINLNTLSLSYMTGDTVSWAEDEEALIMFLKYELAHFRLRSTGKFIPYGQSILENAVDVWKKLDLLFDSLIIYRLNRAPSRFVFYVDVGNAQGADVENIVKRQLNKINKKEYIGPNGQLNERYQLLDMNANIYIPMQKESKSKVDLLQGAQNVGEIEDVSFLNNRLFSALKVPKAFLGFEGDVSSKGMLSQQNVTFGKSIQNLQEDFLETIKDICIIHLAIRGISTLDDLKSFDLVMSRPSYIEEKAKVEIEAAKVSLASSLDGFGVNKKWIAKHILGRTDSEVEAMFRFDPTMPNPNSAPGLGAGMPLPGGDLGMAPGLDMGMGGMAPAGPEMGAQEAMPAAPMAPAEVPLQQHTTHEGDLLVENHQVRLRVSQSKRLVKSLSEQIRQNGLSAYDVVTRKNGTTSEPTKLTEPTVIFE